MRVVRPHGVDLRSRMQASRGGTDMARNGFGRFVTEDWLAVLVGLALVALVLGGLMRNIP